MRSILVALTALLLWPSTGLAGEVIATAPATQSPPAAAPVAPLQGADAMSSGSSVTVGPCGPEAVTDDGKTETRPHGYVEAGVGTGGYRHIAAGVCKPLANGGAIAVSVSESQMHGRQ